MAGSRTPRRARPVEILIGRRVKERRLVLGMSQTELAQKIGVTLQQLQKYEKGVNRIAFSRMLRVAAVLKVDITYFSEGVAGRSNVHRGDALVLSRNCVELVRAYSRIRNRRFQTQALAMVKALAKAR